MQLRDYQIAAVNSIFEYFQNKNGNPVIAMPTGTGKSLVIAAFLQQVFYHWPYTRVMMLTHVKKLIEQNAQKLLQMWPTAPLGIYSAGLKQRDVMLPIIFAGIASVCRRPELFGHRDLIIIDECHLLSQNTDSMYQETILALKAINPRLKIIGLSATPWRMKQGMLTEGKDSLFTDVCYDITGVDEFNKLIDQGYLAPLIAKPTNTVIDLSNVGIVGGEYNMKQAEAAADKDEVIYSGVKEAVALGQNRACWLTFASGIKSAEHLAAMFQMFGISAAASHSGLSDAENDERHKAWVRGELRCLVSNNKYTTGIDHPPIDFMPIFRATLSTGLHVQMLGRGTRPSPDTGKANCLVLDFAGNIARLGPINDPRVPRAAGGGGGDLPVKICESCGTYNHCSARVCCLCGAPFLFKNKLYNEARTDAPIRKTEPIIETFEVQRVIYALHEKKGPDGSLISPPSMRVSYFSGLRMFNEWVCLEHPGIAGKKARDWWRQRHNEEPPLNTHEALRRQSELRKPLRIRVHVNIKWPEVIAHEYF